MLQQYIVQLRITIEAYKAVWPFIKENRLWQDFGQIKWIARLLMAAGILLGLKLIASFEFQIFSPFNPQIIKTAGANLSHISSSLYQLFEGLYQGSYKYLILIFMQALIGHFAGKTWQQLSATPYTPDFTQYLHDQWRALKVGMVSWCREIFYGAILSAALGIIQLYFLKTPLVFLLQCYLMGFTIADVYSAHQNKTINQSYRYLARYIPVLIFSGLLYYLLLLLPIAGPPVAAILCSVAVLLALHRLESTTLPNTSIAANHEQ